MKAGLGPAVGGGLPEVLLLRAKRMNSGPEDRYGVRILFLSILVLVCNCFLYFWPRTTSPGKAPVSLLFGHCSHLDSLLDGLLSSQSLATMQRLGWELASLRTRCPRRETPVALPEVFGPQGDTGRTRSGRARSSGIGACGTTSSDGIGDARGGDGEERNCSAKQDLCSHDGSTPGPQPK